MTGQALAASSDLLVRIPTYRKARAGEDYAFNGVSSLRGSRESTIPPWHRDPSGVLAMARLVVR